jgi:hypothetical protein
VAEPTSQPLGGRQAESPIRGLLSLCRYQESLGLVFRDAREEIGRRDWRGALNVWIVLQEGSQAAGRAKKWIIERKAFGAEPCGGIWAAEGALLAGLFTRSYRAPRSAIV